MGGAYGGKGPMTNAVLWVEVVVFGFFVALRLYTRKVILNTVGVDDFLVMIAFVLHILYTALVSVGTYYGVGQLSADVGDLNIYMQGMKWELISQVAGLMAIGVGKLAVGWFLLRIVRNKVQIAIIWVCLVITTVLTLFASIAAIVQCIPVESIWNPTVEGTCWVNFSHVGYTVGSWFVAADFSFAILPWFVVWDLNMKQKEKITVACGLSLGIFAGVCGIVRTVALAGLSAQEYIYDTVGMLIWSATESCVTIMCSTIPVLRPLYSRIKYGKDGKSSTSGNSSYKLPMYLNRSKNNGGTSKSRFDTSIINPNRSSRQATAMPYSTTNTSNENILHGAADIEIERTDEFVVTYERFDKKG